ncbi:MAG: hypothetical protein ABJL67_08120 [Sulfitobacter sp.]
MAKILSFRNKDSVTSNQDFLTDEHEKLSFRMGDDGAVSLGEVSENSMPDVLPDPKKDWANQELADLFRVRQLLSGAGVPVDTMRGVTDEGDPWFIYCHMNGDVFIHMARIDGAYVLDSPNVKRALRGRDFNELIADFTSDALPSYATAGEEDSEQRVVRLERGGKVRLHPSAMLAALIWTLFMASEELVMLAPEENAAGDDELLDFSHVISTEFEPYLTDMEAGDQDSFGTSDTAAKDMTLDAVHTTAESHGQMRETMGQQGIAMQQNAYAMGLSTIAIAMGFMSETVLLDNQRKVLEGLQSLGFSEYVAGDEGDITLEQIAGEDSNILLDMLAEFLGFDLSLDTEVAEAQNIDAEMTAQDILHLTAAATETPLVPQKTTEIVLTKAEDTDLSETGIEVTGFNQLASETVTVLMTDDPDTETQTMSDLLGEQLQLEEFQLGQTTVLANFDLTQTDSYVISDVIVVNKRTTDHREFDEQAQAFIDYVHAKDTEVGIVTVGNEIIMIDRSAFGHQSGAETYSFSWETNEGQIISMIGLRAEFQQFDLIA